jgi:hypothetical protein
MMKETFRETRFSKKNTELLDTILNIMDEYADKNIKMTQRQLYYQLVSRDIIPNLKTEYAKMCKLTTNARYAGIIDWDAIEDRTRVAKRPSQWNSLSDIMDSVRTQYRLPRWGDQDYYIELFTEKDALSSILRPITEEWHVHFAVNRGYGSATAIYDLSKRIGRQIVAGKNCIILYLGDHDPSGLDMVRDIDDRLKEFLAGTFEEGKGLINVDHIALTTSQVEKYNPPPNPAKIKDPRAKWYIAKYGSVSWEVDALPPDVMIDLVVNTIKKYVDPDKMQQIKKKEKKHLAALERFLEDSGLS